MYERRWGELRQQVRWRLRLGVVRGQRRQVRLARTALLARGQRGLVLVLLRL